MDFRFKQVGGSSRKIRCSIRRDVMSGGSFGFREATDPMLPRKASKGVKAVTVPQTDTGRRVEYTKALERTLVKELGKLTP